MTRTLHVVKVFVGPDGGGGNDLGVFLDVPDWPAERRQRIAADLGYAETVFVADVKRAELWIHTPATELPLAGHPLVGTSWLLMRQGIPVDVLRPPAGAVPTWSVDGRAWIRADPESAPNFELRQLPGVAEVESFPGAGPDELLDVWAWVDEAAGRVRSRVFAPAVGVREDEATGSAALRMGALLGRPLVIRQGVGSEILVAPGPDGTVEVGGRVDHVETRPYTS